MYCILVLVVCFRVLYATPLLVCSLALGFLFTGGFGLVIALRVIVDVALMMIYWWASWVG